MEFKKEHVWIAAGGILAGLLLGPLFFGRSTPQISMMSPAPDAKVEQNYRRSGFGDRLMSLERRKNFSDCYKTMLRNNGYNENSPTPKPGSEMEARNTFEGKVTTVFHLDEDGTVLNYEVIDSEITDRVFVRCIQSALKGSRFMPPPLGINRHIAYDLMFRSDEAFRKEMEEKRNQPPLALITATPGTQNAPQPNQGDTSQQQPPPPPPPLPSQPKK